MNTDFEHIIEAMQERLTLLAPPSTDQHEYLAGRRWLSRAIIHLCLDMASRHVEASGHFHAYAASVYQTNISTYKRLTESLTAAEEELKQESSPETAGFDRIVANQTVHAARLAAITGKAREQVLQIFSNLHDLEMSKHYASLLQLMEVTDPEQPRRIAKAVGRTTVVQGTSIAIGLLVLGPPGVVAGAAFGLLMDAPSLRNAFVKQPALSKLNDRVLRELDEFDVAAINWCIATELMIRKLDDVRKQRAETPDVEVVRAAVLQRLSEFYGA